MLFKCVSGWAQLVRAGDGERSAYPGAGETAVTKFINLESLSMERLRDSEAQVGGIKLPGSERRGPYRGSSHPDMFITPRAALCAL